MTAAIAFCSALILAVLAGLFCTWRTRDTGYDDPRDVTDPDGSVWLRSLAAGPGQPAPRAREQHHELSPFPAPGRLAIEPVPQPDDTRPQPVLKDVAACELGMAVQDYVDGVFAPAEATIKALIDRYAEVTG